MDAEVPEAELEDFDPAAFFGGAAEAPVDSSTTTHGFCFEVERCFADRVPVIFTDPIACIADVEVPAGIAPNFAIETRDGLGHCLPSGECLVPMNHHDEAITRHRDTGWVERRRSRSHWSFGSFPEGRLRTPLARSRASGPANWKTHHSPICSAFSAVDGSAPPPSTATEGRNDGAP